MDNSPKYITSDKVTYLKHSTVKKTNVKPIVKTHIAFWVPLYINSLHYLCRFFGTEPDPIKKRKIIAKGIRWERVQ
ncbi:hypothetical protein [uncultured Shewanella sp.]|uniref:hypothetical protein n=1 Tax=uncultured Shewanella sp. TaxID=173975 RepID=UPI0026068A2B|nr:hypothetical protein [uncultured Shewanella sp.]